MADRYEEWNRSAPQFITDLNRDFGLTPVQASGFPGNGAVESNYFRDIIEDGAKQKGWAGGHGWFQWTGTKKGDRRYEFEAWLKRTAHLGYRADNYMGNYSMLFRELKGAEGRRVLPFLRQCTSVDQAAFVVGKHFERPADLNASLAKRQKAAREALELWEKHKPKPTVWPTDKPLPPEPEKPPVPIDTLPDPKSPGSSNRFRGIWLVIAGVLAEVITKYTGMPVNADALMTFALQYGPDIVTAIGAAVAWYGQKNATTAITGTPLARTIELVKERGEAYGIPEFPQGMPDPYPGAPTPSGQPLQAVSPVDKAASVVKDTQELIDLINQLRETLRPLGVIKVNASPGETT